MSASDKKRLRKEERLAALTEKQKQAQKEAKKLKVMTISFVTVLAVVVVIFGWMMIDSYLKVNGTLEKNTIAATVDGTDLNTIDFTYYYSDAIDNYYQSISEAASQYSMDAKTYAQIFYQLDTEKSLAKQTNPETGDSWANYFMEIALGNAKSDIAIYNKAMADESFDVNCEEVKNAVDYASQDLMLYGYLYGDVDAYLRQVYCNGAGEESYLEYHRRNAIASVYYNKYMDALDFTKEEIDTYTKDRYNHFSAFNYNYYTINYTSYLKSEEGTKDENGTVTYTKEQKDAARNAARKDAEMLAQCNSVEAFNLAIANLSFNKDLETPATSSAYTDVLYTSLKEEYRNWMADPERKANDMKVFPIESTETDANGNETKVANSYNVFIYLSTNENLKQHGNVRHLLVQFEQTLDETTGQYKVTDDAKKAAKEEADKLYADWKAAGATKDAFIALIEEHSDDPGKAENKGLYENIHPASQYLDPFLKWAIDEKRVVGDHGIVETSDGYHIMYFEGYSAETYRDYLVNTSMVNDEMKQWYTSIVDVAEAKLNNTSRVKTGRSLASNS